MHWAYVHKKLNKNFLYSRYNKVGFHNIVLKHISNPKIKIEVLKIKKKLIYFIIAWNKLT